MKYIVQLKCDLKNYTYLIKKILQNNISVIDSKVKNNEYFFNIYEDEYERLLQLDYKKVIIFVNYKGLYNIYNFITANILYVVITLTIIFILFLSNIFIFKVNIHTNDINLEKKIMYYLMDNNISDFSVKKSFSKLKNIKKKLLNKYQNEIEWLEIKSDGYIYNVYLIKRTNEKPKKKNGLCNYIAKKSGTITKIFASKGELLVQENNYVNAGDVLISGKIIYNDEVKNEVCAKGKIYGEVWYEVDLSYPLIKSNYVINNKKQYNISINFFNKKYKLFKNKYKEEKSVKKIGNNKFGINVINSYKTRRKINKISEKEAIVKAIKKAKKSIMLKTRNKSNILSQNILKKYVKNDTIYMKVLITSEEELGVVESY
ncbi:MAG: sporulation protein YqfD [Bacilli bacterium]|nr:sporulation protein YqfD [Bacilli bacterium]